MQAGCEWLQTEQEEGDGGQCGRKLVNLMLYNSTQGPPVQLWSFLVPDLAQVSISIKTLRPLCSNKIIQPDVAQSLRLAATLVNGVVIVFNKQTTVLIGEQCSLSLSRPP